MVNQEPEENKQVTPAASSDATASFEQAIADSETQRYYLRLYIAGTTSRSILALQRLKEICETYLQGRYELEVIDIYQSSQPLQKDNIVAVPTLIKQLPSPLRRIIGDLSDTEKVLLGLDLVPK